MDVIDIFRFSIELFIVYISENSLFKNARLKLFTKQHHTITLLIDKREQKIFNIYILYKR